MVGFHDPLLAETEFRQHLPAALQIHVLARRLCIRRTTGRICRNSGTDQSRPWKLTTSTHPWAVQKTWTIQNRYGYRYATICIFRTVSLSNGRRLGYVTYEHNTESGVAYAAHLWARRHVWCGLLLLILLSPPGPNLINKIMSIQNFNSTIRKSSISYYLSSQQKVLKYGFASDMLPFIWPWAWTITNITCSKKEVHDSPRILWHTQPNHHIITTESCLGMDVSHGFNDKH